MTYHNNIIHSSLSLIIMRLFLFVLLAIIWQCQSLQAQNLLKKGSYWNYGAMLPSGPVFRYTQYIVGDSTAPDGTRLIDIEEHAQGYGNTHISPPSPPDISFRNDTIFRDGTFYFRYNVFIGDTVRNIAASSINSKAHSYYVIDSISTIVLASSGDTLRQFHTQKNYSTPSFTSPSHDSCQLVTIIEYIGPIDHPLHLWYAPATGSTTTPCERDYWTIYKEFDCFSSDSLTTYPIGQACSKLVDANVSVDKITLAESSIKIGPNPFQEETTITIEGIIPHRLQLLLFDHTGRLVKELTAYSNNQITLSRAGLQNGMYFYQIYDEEKILGSGKLVVLP